MLHKDGPLFGQPRYHRPRWGMIFYYPQAVEDDMGPTKVLPSSQYLFQNFGNPSADAELPPPHRLTCAAGTVVIAHYDLFHGATAHLSDKNRQMHKLLVVRTEEPPPRAGPTPPPPFWEAPGRRVGAARQFARLGRAHTEDSWDAAADASRSDAAGEAAAAAGGGGTHPALPLRAVWTTVWRWYCGLSVAAVQGTFGGMAAADVNVPAPPTAESLWTGVVATQREAADTLALHAVLGSYGTVAKGSAAAAAAAAAATPGLGHADEVVRLCCRSKPDEMSSAQHRTRPLWRC